MINGDMKDRLISHNSSFIKNPIFNKEESLSGPKDYPEESKEDDED